MNLRARAAKAICRVAGSGLTLDVALEQCLHGVERAEDRGFIKELCFGTLRWFDQVEFALGRYLDKPLRQKDSDVKILILTGLYQLHYLGIPPHAAISETVEATVELDKAWAKPLVNAVLRRSQREQQRLQAELERHPGAHCSHPDWLTNMVRTDWPECWEAILHANNRRPPQHLRVNLSRTSRKNYMERLEQAGIPAQPLGLTPSGVLVTNPVDVRELPGFEEGHVSIQDAGAQLAAGLLCAQPGNLVLDACAAPGGKTAHILEMQPQLAGVTALDIDEKRMARLHATLSRLAFEATIVRADAAATQDWWDGRLFDRILLDAPCSATGVIRRHPDVKRLKTPEQAPALQAGQGALLAALWPLLKPGGRLLYSTCSLLRAENDRVIETFLGNHASAGLEAIPAEWGVPTACGRQLLPGVDGTDGFYYALLTKVDQGPSPNLHS